MRDVFLKVALPARRPGRTRRRTNGDHWATPRIRDPDVVGRVDGDSGRPLQGCETGLDASERREKFAGAVELADSIVPTELGNIDCPGRIHGDVSGEHELSGTSAPFTKTEKLSAVDVEDQDTVPVRVGDENPTMVVRADSGRLPKVRLWIGNPPGQLPETPGPKTLNSAGPVEDKKFRILGSRDSPRLDERRVAVTLPTNGEDARRNGGATRIASEQQGRHQHAFGDCKQCGTEVLRVIYSMPCSCVPHGLLADARGSHTSE